MKNELIYSIVGQHRIQEKLNFLRKALILNFKRMSFLLNIM